ncbi:TetR/AcrR family transcriptional regulator [Nocardioides sp. KC13]|uniref:TetR/AcrR family transcriptional regulator n=1 Tax=Nocardioides turkmenicus TaxID=2711220 RepID=A0A6M1R9F8_9ACTN|nr:TetR/AcrR family transcriptional regulator [Nocardioides sp. KC13]NGN94238.1 TetR/AcrR family transcriptional regulator [Nocardioides sp. KC13]
MPSDRPAARRPYAARMPLEERREELLDAALRVLVRDGYGRLTISAIAAEAGVTRPVVYDAYGGIDPLLHALLDRTRQRALDATLALIPTGGVRIELDRWMLEAADGLLRAAQSDPETWRPVLGLIDGAPPVVRERTEGTLALVRGFVADVLRTNLDPGTELDVEVVAHSLVALVQEFARLLLTRPDEYPKERLLAAYAGILALRRRP